MLLLLSFEQLKVEKFLVPLKYFVRTMLGATFILFVLSLQTPMYETHENKNNGNLRMQNVTSKETSAAPMYYEENPTSLYPHVHIVNNPFAISSNITESQGNDPNVFHFSGNAPLNQLLVLTEMLLVLQALFGMTVSIEMLLIFLITEMPRTVIEILHYLNLKIFVVSQKRNKRIFLFFD